MITKMSDKNIDIQVNEHVDLVVSQYVVDANVILYYSHRELDESMKDVTEEREQKLEKIDAA
ncbi:MAG: hypothetical protein COZ46_02280 [Verrucomicrobia bacterium CG_4_10_14_3_um_filter_43_23]|nr:MAG: hypothetical protein AUJ82_06680 [Verrucomicrobia bacterium CG1_02_43_26]PIP59768.1 MAG: hypothetical protein COX01_01790 [Verrucomicrobia bacterium CG22_combo_CG10-13_8_21_14_all_43_17]PIX58757.1 MAG: hypothetical protein COZ46_02280 [Verrucomicrobia bacterium CG_4_10_14_3_um_filter_43_23]PIY61110.1 MAG: hypothetical protein COY94_07075 [Verrucomicrobia bacterium CG_4_10_14_0_8_um_filter_43_34]PJA43522.1 MAG: hypothetical protein CO175_07755 [Verrucomicrobia bacterium CG_4_9_14_3_um_fi